MAKMKPYYRLTFLSTFPLRGTSIDGIPADGDEKISIHVPLAGNVGTWTRHPYPRWHFYPRSPCGERLVRLGSPPGLGYISIHVPLAGNVLPSLTPSGAQHIFLSTFPLRGTSNHALSQQTTPRKFLSTFPLRGTSSEDLIHYSES